MLAVAVAQHQQPPAQQALAVETVLVLKARQALRTGHQLTQQEVPLVRAVAQASCSREPEQGRPAPQAMRRVVAVRRCLARQVLGLHQGLTRLKGCRSSGCTPVASWPWLHCRPGACCSQPGELGWL